MTMKYQVTRLTRCAGGKLLTYSLLFSCLGLFSSLAAAQLPELGSPSTGSGIATTAKFFGGAISSPGKPF